MSTCPEMDAAILVRIMLVKMNGLPQFVQLMCEFCKINAKDLGTFYHISLFHSDA